MLGVKIGWFKQDYHRVVKASMFSHLASAHFSFFLLSLPDFFICSYVDVRFRLNFKRLLYFCSHHKHVFFFGRMRQPSVPLNDGVKQEMKESCIS